MLLQWKFWMAILTGIRDWGVRDVFFVVCHCEAGRVLLGGCFLTRFAIDPIWPGR